MLADLAFTRGPAGLGTVFEPTLNSEASRSGLANSKDGSSTSTLERLILVKLPSLSISSLYSVYRLLLRF